MDVVLAGRRKKGGRSSSIDELLGFALGVLRLSLSDFCTLSPSEFESVCIQYKSERDALQRDSWERMRLASAIAVQPHVKGTVNPRKLVPLPWDKTAKMDSGADYPRVCTKEERERLMKLAHGQHD